MCSQNKDEFLMKIRSFGSILSSSLAVLFVPQCLLLERKMHLFLEKLSTLTRVTVITRFSAWLLINVLGFSWPIRLKNPQRDWRPIYH